MEPDWHQGLDTSASKQAARNVPMDVIVPVDGFYGENSLSNVEAGHFLGESIFTHEEGHHVTTWKVFHYEVQILVILE